MYKNKYKLYKEKYFMLEAGSYFINNIPENNNIIPQKIKDQFLKNQNILLNDKNLGQHNCGVLFIENYFFKCIRSFQKDSISEQINKIKENKIDKFFPTFYKFEKENEFFINEKEQNLFIIMEKMDKDLQTILMELIYKDLNKSSFYLINFDFINKNLPNTMNEPKNQIEKNKLIEFIKENLNKENIKNQLVYINKDIIKLHHNLLKNGFYYADYKFDNIGVNIKNNHNEYKFLDIESGFGEIKYIENIENNYVEDSLRNFSRSSNILDYSINGQYNIKYLFGIENDYENFINKKKLTLNTDQKIYIFDNNKIFLINNSDENFTYKNFTDYDKNIEIFYILKIEENKKYNYLKYKILKTSLENFEKMNFIIQEDTRFTECIGFFYFQQVYNIYEENEINRFIYTKTQVKNKLDILIDEINITFNDFINLIDN